MKLEDQEWVINQNTGKKIDMKKLLTEQRLALIYIDSRFPFFSNLLRNLTWIYTFQVPTQATDGTRILVNPEFTSGLSIKEKAFVMMHECMHCALNHMERRGSRDPYKSNIAADYEVNDLLVMDGIVSASDINKIGALYDSKYDGMNFEHIYSLNPPGPPQPPTQEGGQQGSGNGIGGGGNDDGTGKGSGGDKSDNKNGKSSSSSNGSGAEGLNGNTTGGGSSNQQANQKTREQAAEACSSVGGFVDQEDGAKIAKSEGYDEGDCKVKSKSEVTREWEEASIEACSKANSPGVGNIMHRIQDVYMTSTDWKGELKKYVGRALNNMDTNSRLGKKKWLAQGEIKKYDSPSEDAFDQVIFLIDSSGSISDKLLQTLCSECYTICKKKKVKKVVYIYYDDGIRKIITNDTIKVDGVIDPKYLDKNRNVFKGKHNVIGRGGNEETHVMDELVEILKKSHKKPELVMWFTDGYTYSIPKKPSIIKNMIWVVYDNPEFKSADGSRVIHIKSEDLGK